MECKESLAFQPQLGFGIYRRKENIPTIDVALNLSESQLSQFDEAPPYDDLIYTTN